MPDLSDLIDALEAKRQRELKDINSRYDEKISKLSEAYEEALREISTDDVVPSPPAVEVGSTPGEEEDPDQPPVIEAVEDLLRAHSGRSWTAPQIHQRLQGEGYTFQAKKLSVQKHTVGMALAKLVRRNKAFIARRGSGNKPHRYRIKSKTQATGHSLFDD